MPAPSRMFMSGGYGGRLTVDAALSQAARERAPSHTWRVERNHKMHFCVVRDTKEGREVLKSASGRDSSFKTSAGARRACDRANREAADVEV